MRKYENFFIADPDLSDESASGLQDKLKDIISSYQGTLLNYEFWGKKKLAYPIRKRTRGQYVLMQFACDPPALSELERNMRLDDRVLKFITVKLEDRFDPEKEAQTQARKPSVFEEEETREEAGEEATSETPSGERAEEERTEQPEREPEPASGSEEEK